MWSAERPGVLRSDRWRSPCTDHVSKRSDEPSINEPDAQILANACEAIIGSIYIDQGWDGAKKFIDLYILSKLPDILEHKLYLDPKSRFQESSQERTGITPVYRVDKEWGPDHNKQFRIAVFLESEEIASGEGSSKQEAQVAAAEAALDAKGWK